MKLLLSIVVPLLAFGLGKELLQEVPDDLRAALFPSVIAASFIVHVLIAAERRDGRLVYTNRVRYHKTYNAKPMIWGSVLVALVFLLPWGCGVLTKSFRLPM